MSVRVELDRPYPFYTNLDIISGRVILQLNTHENISAITVKLEGEGRSQLTGLLSLRGPNDPFASQQTDQEIHKLLYKIVTVFPDPKSGISRGVRSTISPGRWEWPFTFKIPINNNCRENAVLSGGFNAMRSDALLGPQAHVKRTLPPSTGSVAGLAEIQYFVKATVQRSSLFKENIRGHCSFNFFPIEPPRPAPNARESFARIQYQFRPGLSALSTGGSQTGFFRKKSATSTPANISSGNIQPPSITIDGRLPDPPIITCNQPIPLRFLVSMPSSFHARIILDMINIDLVAYTNIRAESFTHTETNPFTIFSRNNLQMTLDMQPDVKDPTHLTAEIDRNMWQQLPLPNTVSPSFTTCNLSRTYVIYVKIGLKWCPSTSSEAGPMLSSELAVQTLRMPVDLYSGVAPPQALLDAMSNQPSSVSGRPTHPPRPSATHAAPPITMHSQAQHPSDHIEPSPADIPPDAPPSYEDAMADQIAPVQNAGTNAGPGRSPP